MMNRIIHHLKNSREVLLATHANPDGDAIGSLIGMGLCLDALGKRTTLHNESPIPAVYRFLSGVERVERKVDPDRSFDTAVVLDCGSLQRIGEAVPQLERIPVVVNIDHHVTNTGFGHYQLIDTSACATAEIVYRLMKQMKVPVGREIAAAIYTGILADTGSFRFSNTNKAAFEICREMVDAGVDPYAIAQHVYGSPYSLGRIKLLNLSLDTIEISPNGKLSMMAVTQNMLNETGTQPEDTNGLIYYAKRIRAVRVAAMIQENRDCKNGSGSRACYHVSLRSDGTVDVAALAAGFGGGGHPTAAGFTIDMSLPEIRARLLDFAEKL
jgi:bifunctional oligoribonuclease and PAP phosphatase NrnA